MQVTTPPAPAQVPWLAVAATKQMISYTRDHPVAESFAYLNALQPAIFDIEEIKRALKSQQRA